MLDILEKIWSDLTRWRWSIRWGRRTSAEGSRFRQDRRGDLSLKNFAGPLLVLSPTDYDFAPRRRPKALDLRQRVVVEQAAA